MPNLDKIRVYPISFLLAITILEAPLRGAFTPEIILSLPVGLLEVIVLTLQLHGVLNI